MHKISEDHFSILENIKENLTIGVKNRHHGFHSPVFTNIIENGSATSRIVILRLFDANNYQINFHSDIRSKKIVELRKKPSTNFLFYDHQIKIQLRIKTQSFIHHEDIISKNAWQLTRLISRKCYLTTKSPSSFTSLAEDGVPEILKGKSPDQKQSENGYKNFAVISNMIESIEWLHLAHSGHRRLHIDLKHGVDKISFQWMIP